MNSNTLRKVKTAVYLFLTILSPVFLVSGCASSEPFRVSYDSPTNTSTFQSTRGVFGHRDMQGGLATNQRILWQAEAVCAGGIRCTPDVVEIVFFNDTNTVLNLDYRRLKLFFDGQTLDWYDESRDDESPYATTPKGEFMRITMSGLDFSAMAHAKNVEAHFGLTATSVFKIPPQRRDTFRRLAKTMGLAP